MNRIVAEVCANTICSAIAGQEGGAVRIELCDNLSEGGTTAAWSQIRLAKEILDININVLIRPRGGSFQYNKIEFEAMKMDIHLCGREGCDGVVFGVLESDKSIDMERNKELVDIARSYGMSSTFHRAFDLCPDLYVALEQVIELGCDRILTSGGMPTASEGSINLKKLIEKAADRIIIMPGGGVTEDNVQMLAEFTGLKEFHGSFRSYSQEAEIMQTEADKVRNAIKNANKAIFNY